MLNKGLLILLCYSTISVSSLTDQAKLSTNYVSFAANENGTCYRRLPYNETVADDIEKGILKVPAGSQPIGTKQPGDWVTVIDCCEGYLRSNETNACEPQCDEGCVGGNCTGPNLCSCEEGWYPERGICKPVCRQRCQQNAYCFAPDTCSCQFGYEEVNGRCKPACLNDCANGQCVAPRVCRCYIGYNLNETGRCEPICEGGCPNGTCSSPGVCSCNEGYENPQDNIETCVPSCSGGCLNGRCSAPGECDCRIGYNLSDNGTSCMPQCQNECVNGFCVAPDLCECDPGYSMDFYTQKCLKGRDNNNNQGNFRFGNDRQNPGSSRPYGTNYGSTTSRPALQFGTFNPPTENRGQITEGFSRGQSTESPSRGQGQPGQRVPGSQTTIDDRFRDPNNRNDYNYNGQYQTHGSRQPDNPREVLGLDGVSHRESNQRPLNPYGNYDSDQKPRPQQASTQGPYRNSQDEKTTQRPNLYGTVDTNQSQQPRKPPTVQGFFPALDAGVNRRPTNTAPSRNHYESDIPNQSFESPRFNPQTQRPQTTTNSYESHQRFVDPADVQRTNLYPHSTQLPPQSTSVHSQGIAANKEQTVRPSGVVQLSPSQNPYRNHQHSQSPYDNRDSSQVTIGSGPLHVTNSHKNSPDTYPRPFQFPNRENTPLPGIYGQNEPTHEAHGHYITRDGSYLPINNPSGQGVKTANQRPSPNQVYGRPALVQTPEGFPQVSVLAFEMHEIVPGESEYGDSMEGLSPFFNSPFGSINQFSHICSIPCINGVCVGPNKCACKQGYAPDSRHPFEYVCMPVCRGGCLNGICTAPDLCLCNPGFTKEGGVKGSEKCIPIY